MVYRIYVEKKPGFDVEAEGLKNELVSLLGVSDADRSAPAQPLRRGGHRRGTVPAVVHPPCSASRRWITPTTRCLSSRVCPLPWSICPASSTSAPTRPPSASSSSAQGERPLVRYGPGLSAAGQPDRGAGGGDQEVCHQPGGGPRGLAWKQQDTLKMEYPIPSRRGGAGRASTSWTRRA